jgi:hypothetical protein
MIGRRRSGGGEWAMDEDGGPLDHVGDRATVDFALNFEGELL